MEVRRASVRSYLAGLREMALVPGATEHTLRDPLVRFLIDAASDLDMGSVTVRAELRLSDPFRLADHGDAETQLLPASEAWRENLSRELVERLGDAYGERPSVEDVGWFVLGVLSAPSYREDFRGMSSLGEGLGRAHLLEAPIGDDVRFEGEGPSVVESVRYDPAVESIGINKAQRFSGVPAEAWAWGGAFRPVEHFLDDRRGRRLDAEQIAMFQSAIWAVRESIRLGPALDETLADVLATTLDFGSHGLAA